MYCFDIHMYLIILEKQLREIERWPKRNGQEQSNEGDVVDVRESQYPPVAREKVGVHLYLRIGLIRM